MLLTVIVQGLGPCLVMPIFDKYLSCVSDILMERPISLLELPLAVVDLYRSGGPGRSTHYKAFEEGWTLQRTSVTSDDTLSTSNESWLSS